MRKRNYLLALFSAAMLMTSCNDALEVEGLYPNLGEKAVEGLSAQTLTVDSLEMENAIQLEETEELKALKEKLEARKKQRASAFGYNDYDEHFYSNIYAIREMPLTISARGLVGNTRNKYLSCEGANNEVVLTDYTTNRQHFYLRVLPATSGIPYLIYAGSSMTPLVVGYYTNNPANKILFAQSPDETSLFSASWDLIPSQTKGYFAIESQSYIGQSDPNNMWSVFNYALEVKNDNKIGYGQYTKKTYQEFQITPTSSFDITEVIYDEPSQVLTKVADIQIKSTGLNTSVEPKPFTIPVKKNFIETSYFHENPSSIKFNVYSTKIQRPTVEANKVVLPKVGTPYDANYFSSTIQNITQPIAFDIVGEAPENCLIEVISYITAYNVSINYTAKAVYNKREILFSGTWRGYIISDPKLAKPTHISRFFDLDTGEEIFTYSARKN